MDDRCIKSGKEAGDGCIKYKCDNGQLTPTYIGKNKCVNERLTLTYIG